MPFFVPENFMAPIIFFFKPDILRIGSGLGNRIVVHCRTYVLFREFCGGNPPFGDLYVWSPSFLLQNLQCKAVNPQLFDFMDCPGPWFPQIRMTG